MSGENKKRKKKKKNGVDTAKDNKVNKTHTHKKKPTRKRALQKETEKKKRATMMLCEELQDSFRMTANIKTQFAWTRLKKEKKESESL